MNDSQKCGLIMGIIFLIWLGILIHVLSGCNMAAGFFQDTENFSRNMHERIVSDHEMK